MKLKVIGVFYIAALTFVLTLNSCQDDPITPNSPGGNPVDTTWIDSNYNGGGGTPYDSTGNNGGGNTTDSTWIDSTYTGGGCPGGIPADSTWIDSTYNGGTNPYDSIP